VLAAGPGVMDTIVQALVMGVVQGLTEFLPISSSGHLILVPAMLGWDDPFITSLAFSVMLHMGTLVALLVYFREDWLRLVPAGLAALRDRTFGDDPDRKLAWLLLATTIPAIIAGLILGDSVETAVRQPGLVALMLLVGAAILWIADRAKGSRAIGGLTFPIALGIGAAQAIALIPGISRSGISIAAGRFAGLDRPSAARFSFLMAAPIIAMAGAYETIKLIRAGAESGVELGPMVVGMLAALISGLLAIHFLLRWLAGHSLDIFVVYRIVLAAIVIIWFLNP
jgi:undecaprenyl-diphosphatase